MMPISNWKMQLLVQITLTLSWSFHHVFIECRSGYVSEVVMESKFYCDTSKMKIYNATSELFCVHKCVKFENCHLLNYRVDKNASKNCEVFRLPDNHKSCKMLRGEKNWKALVYKARCGIKNFCFPCSCKEDCKPNERDCLCSSGLILPTVHISFEEVTDDSLVMYSRGEDMSSNSSASMHNGAKVGPADGRIGKVLHLSGTDSGMIVGDYASSYINNPSSKSFTVAFWIRVLSPHVRTQTILGTGRHDRDTGILMQIAESATKIRAWLVESNGYYKLECNVGDMLKSWTHVALVSVSKSSQKLKLFINGGFAKESIVKKNTNTDWKLFESLVFGAVDALFPLNSDYYNIQIDEFAMWSKTLSNVQISYIMKQNYLSCEG